MRERGDGVLAGRLPVPSKGGAKPPLGAARAALRHDVLSPRTGCLRPEMARALVACPAAPQHAISMHGLSIVQLFEPNVHFFLVRLDGLAFQVASVSASGRRYGPGSDRRVRTMRSQTRSNVRHQTAL
jgi:hypothetical protein